MWHEWETGELHTRILWLYLKKRDHSEDVGVGGRILKRILTWRHRPH